MPRLADLAPQRIVAVLAAHDWLTLEELADRAAVSRSSAEKAIAELRRPGRGPLGGASRPRLEVLDRCRGGSRARLYRLTPDDPARRA